ncbi:MAG: class A beta-lactamase-related serine hydrolase [Sphingomonas sp.]|nr:class A beta-lactamase-related serine hydrolase [Sphingomonas sp.]
MRFLTSLLALLLLFGQPALAATVPALQSFEQQLASMIQSRSGDYGVAALDLESGELISVRGDEPFPMASTVKIAVAANYLAQVEHGRRSLSDRISGQSAKSLIEAMMIRSDNRATDILIRDLGGPKTLQSWLTQQGITGIRIDRNIEQLLRSPRDLWDVRDSSTPKAMVDLLRRIDSGRLLKPQSRSYLLDVMARCQTGKNRMRGMLPRWARVEHKTGTLNGYTSDVGFITLHDGRRIAVAFFARGGNNRPATIAWAARAIYDGFSALAAPFRTAPAFAAP